MPHHPPAETWRKVGIRTGQRLALLRPPENWGGGALPDGVSVTRRRSTRTADVVVAFFRECAELRDAAGSLGGLIVANGAVWTAWPRKATGHVSNLSESILRDALLPTGLVDVKVAALDEDWSGLKFVWRLERRAGLGC